jgi:hypothetical protein
MAIAQRNACTELVKAARKPSPVGLEQPATVRGCHRLYDIRAQRSHAGQCGRLVRADHRRIADHIGCQDAGQTAVGVIHGRQIAALAGHSIVLLLGRLPCPVVQPVRPAIAGSPLCPYASGTNRGLNTSRSLATVTASECQGLASPASHHSPRSHQAISGGFWPSITQ